MFVNYKWKVKEKTADLWHPFWNDFRKWTIERVLFILLFGAVLVACAPTTDPEIEPVVTAAQPAQEVDASVEAETVQNATQTPEPSATATAKSASLSSVPAKPPLFLEETFGLVIFISDDSIDQRELAELTVDNLEAKLNASGALQDIGLAVEQIPDETGGEWAAASVGARMGFWVDATGEDNALAVRANAYFPDDELLLGEGSLGLNRTADAMLEPFAANSILEASDTLADRLAAIVNAYIGYTAVQEGNHTECTRRFNSALDFLNRVEVTLNRADASHNALGLCFAALDRNDEARDHYEAAIAINQDISSAHYGLGNYYFEQGDYKKAGEYFDIAVEKTLVDPMATEKTEARAYAGLGNIALVEGAYEDAITNYDKSIAITPDYPAYYLTRALAKGALGREDYASDLQECIILVDQEREPSAYFLEVAADCQKYHDNGFDFTVEEIETDTDDGFRVDDIYSSISVRNGPGIDGYEVIDYLYADEEVTVVARTPNGVWYLIELENGQRGWINATLLKRAGDNNIEVPLAATIPPTPILTNTPKPTATTPVMIVTPQPQEDKPKKKKTPVPVPTIPVLIIGIGPSMPTETP